MPSRETGIDEKRNIKDLTTLMDDEAATLRSAESKTSGGARCSSSEANLLLLLLSRYYCLLISEAWLLMASCSWFAPRFEAAASSSRGA